METHPRLTAPDFDFLIVTGTGHSKPPELSTTGKEPIFTCQLHMQTLLRTVAMSAVLFLLIVDVYVILVYFFVLYGVFILLISINFTGLICHWQNSVGYFHTYSALEFL